MPFERSTTSPPAAVTSDADTLYSLLAKAARAGQPAPTLRELCAVLRRREHGVRAALAQLIADGLIEAAGSKERRRWRLPALGLITADRPPPSAFFREGRGKAGGTAPCRSTAPAPLVEVREDGVRVTRCPPWSCPREWCSGPQKARRVVICDSPVGSGC